MKKVSLILISFLVIFQSFSQSKSRMTMLGDRSYDNGDYYLAAEYYKEALDASGADKGYLGMRLGECSRQFFDYDQAQKYYKVAYDTDKEKYPLSKYYYGLMLKYNGLYSEAEEVLGDFIATYEPTSPEDDFSQLALMHYNGTVLALDVLKKPQRDYSFKNLGRPANSGYSDFAPVIFDSDSSIFITSSRLKGSEDKVYGVLGGGYTDNYHFIKEGNGWKLKGDEDDEAFKKINTDYNDGAGTFNSDRTKYYYTICGEYNSSKTETTCAIYVSKLDEDEWSKPKKLNDNINPRDQWNAQPTLTSGGDTMFFVSKRPGGIGQHDIWYSVRQGNEDDDWGPAVNLGDKVNTPYIDYSPFYHGEEHALFFASDGHEGFGGQDVFIAVGEDFSTIQNIGLPFNSNRDDFYFVLGEEKGFVSSNRESGLGNDDVYEFNITSNETMIAQLSKDSIENDLITIKGRIMDDDGAPAPGVGVLLADEEGKILKRTETDEDGVFIFANLDPSINYNVLLEEEDPTLFSQVQFSLDNVEIYGADEEEVNTTSLEDTVVASNAPTRVLFEHIYYDFNKSKLRSASKKVLQQLSDYLKKHDNVKVELNGNTDSKGSDAYNQALGKKRSKTAYDYLVSQGIPASSMVVNSLGEGKPIASNENEVGRQLNRRVEFYIVGGGNFETNAMAYVIERPTTISELAQKFNMSEDEVKELNGLSSNRISGKSVVRVKRNGDNVISQLSLNEAQAHVPATNSSAMTYTENTASSTSDNIVYFDDSEWNKGVKYTKYDGTGYYVVLPKNTLWSISRLTNTNVDEIVSMNNIKGNKIYVGQRLRISSSATTTIENTGSVNSSYDSKASTLDAFSNAGIKIMDQHGEVVVIGDEVRYVVKEGDTFWDVSQRFGMTLEELRILNKRENYLVKPGMALLIDSPEEEPEFKLQNDLDGYRAKYKGQAEYGTEEVESADKSEENAEDVEETLEEITE